MVKGVAVVLAQGSLGRSPNMGKNKSRRRLGGNSMEVGTVPRRNGGCEEARGGAEFWVGVEANAKAIGIVLATPRVLKSE